MIAIFSMFGMCPISSTAFIRASKVLANSVGGLFVGNFSIASKLIEGAYNIVLAWAAVGSGSFESFEEGF